MLNAFLAQKVFALVARHIMTAGGAMAVTNGYLDANEVQQAAGALTTLGGLAWSIVEKKKFL